MPKTVMRNEEIPVLPLSYTVAPTMTATGTQTLIPAGQHPRMRLVRAGITMFVAGA